MSDNVSDRAPSEPRPTRVALPPARAAGGPEAPVGAGAAVTRNPGWAAARQFLTSRFLGVVLMVVVLYLVLVVNAVLREETINHQDIARQLGYYGLVTLGVGVLIIAGGIDLSIGSVVALGAVGFALLLQAGWPPVAALGVVLAGGACVGLSHGVLVTSLRLQPFLVTLCGWFMYRGLARWLVDTYAGGASVGLTSKVPPEVTAQAEGMRRLLYSDVTFGVPHPLLLLVLLAAAVGLVMHFTKHGRYLFALGANEDAAKYAGIATGRYQIAAYVLCSVLAGLASVVFILNNRTASAHDAGSLLELYAITGAVLGGCSLRGGEGSVPGIFLGAAVLPLLSLVCNDVLKSQSLEYVVIGVALLLGTIADEVLQRVAARRKTPA